MQCVWDLGSSGGPAWLGVLLAQSSAAPEWGQHVYTWPSALEEVSCQPATDVSKCGLTWQMVWFSTFQYCQGWHTGGKSGFLNLPHISGKVQPAPCENWLMDLPRVLARALS